MSSSRPAAASTPTSPSLLIKRFSEFWDQNCDPYIKELPLFDSPLTFVSLLLSICGIILISEQYVKQRKQDVKLLSGGKSKSKASGNQWQLPIKDERPFVLIHNGFCFGVYGVGLLILIIVTYFGKILFSCDPVIQMTEFHQNSLKHTMYTYLIMTFVALLDPLFRVLAGKPIDHTIDLLHQVIWSCLLSAYTAINPIGITKSLIVIDGIHNVVRYGSAVLSINEKDGSNYKKFLEGVRIIVYFLVSGHIIHVTHAVNNKCRPPAAYGHEGFYKTSLFFPVAVYAAIVIAVSVIRLVSHFINPDIIEKQQQIASVGSGANALTSKTRKSARLTSRGT